MRPVLSYRDFMPRRAEFSLLSCALPQRPEQPIGVLLFDAESDTLYLRLRRDWEHVADADDAEVLAELQEELALRSQAEGGAAVLRQLEDMASLAVRISDREAVTVRDWEQSLRDLYQQHVPAQVLRFQTHLPRYAMAVAAGPFLTNPEDIEAEEWMETPEDLRLDDDMFIARIQGRSMEPRIPDGSYCVFRRNVVGSRNRRLVLVRNSELADENQYTVKRYRSEKQVTEEGFLQTRIRLESLNPEFPSWDLDEDSERYQVIAEFVRVL